MTVGTKYFETGSSPYYLNLSSTAKDFSISDSTSPEFGLLDTLTKFIIVEDGIQIEEVQTEQEFTIEATDPK